MLKFLQASVLLLVIVWINGLSAQCSSGRYSPQPPPPPPPSYGPGKYYNGPPPQYNGPPDRIYYPGSYQPRPYSPYDRYDSYDPYDSYEPLPSTTSPPRTSARTTPRTTVPTTVPTTAATTPAPTPASSTPASSTPAATAATTPNQEQVLIALIEAYLASRRNAQ